jgi:hypothetical protein
MNKVWHPSRWLKRNDWHRPTRNRRCLAAHAVFIRHGWVVVERVVEHCPEMTKA